MYALGVRRDAYIMKYLLDVVWFEPLPQHILRQPLNPRSQRLSLLFLVFLLQNSLILDI